jgi:hypothetical protein
MRLGPFFWRRDIGCLMAQRRALGTYLSVGARLLHRALVTVSSARVSGTDANRVGPDAGLNEGLTQLRRSSVGA